MDGEWSWTIADLCSVVLISIGMNGVKSTVMCRDYVSASFYRVTTAPYRHTQLPIHKLIPES